MRQPSPVTEDGEVRVLDVDLWGFALAMFEPSAVLAAEWRGYDGKAPSERVTAQTPAAFAGRIGPQGQICWAAVNGRGVSKRIVAQGVPKNVLLRTGVARVAGGGAAVRPTPEAKARVRARRATDTFSNTSCMTAPDGS